MFLPFIIKFIKKSLYIMMYVARWAIGRCSLQKNIHILCTIFCGVFLGGCLSLQPKPQGTQLQGISFSALPTINQRRTLIVDVIVVYDEEIAKIFATLTIGDYFKKVQDIAAQKPGSIEVWRYDVLPQSYVLYRLMHIAAAEKAWGIFLAPRYLNTLTAPLHTLNAEIPYVRVDLGENSVLQQSLDDGFFYPSYAQSVGPIIPRLPKISLSQNLLKAQNLPTSLFASSAKNPQKTATQNKEKKPQAASDLTEILNKINTTNSPKKTTNSQKSARQSNAAIGVGDLSTKPHFETIRLLAEAAQKAIQAKKTRM